MRVFITAGEASGDKLGAALIEGLRALVPDVTFEGIGGPRMSEAGLQSLFPMDEISIMGIGEILKEYRHLKARIRETADAVVAAQPDVLITIDLPEFSLRVARLVKAASDVRCVHYVAPTVWAWRPKRADKMAAHIDQVLAVLPFEPPYMQAAGMECDFVGHPVVMDPQASAAEAQAFRQAQGIQGPSALILPGSRRSEVARLLPIFADVARRLHDQRPEMRLIVPAGIQVVDTVQEAARNWPGDPIILDPRADVDGAQKRAAFRAADVAVAASGTVSLELAAAGTPMVIAYDMSWLSRQIIGRMLLVDTVTLVNLVSEDRSVPEFIGKDCDPVAITKAVLDVLDNPQSQNAAMELTMDRLGRGGPSPGERAARAVLDGIRRSADRKP